MMMADRHGRPLSEIASEYSEWEIPYWAAWYSREPTDGRRIEFAISRLHANWLGTHMKKGHKPPKPQDLVIPDYWTAEAKRKKQADAKSDADYLVAMFRGAGCTVNVKDTESEYLDGN